MKINFKVMGTAAKAGVIKFAREEDGVTAIEYGLIAGLIAAVIIGTVTALGTSVKNLFGNVCTALGTNCTLPS